MQEFALGVKGMENGFSVSFFRVVRYRYGRGAQLITTNKGIQDWPELLVNDEVLTTTRARAHTQDGCKSEAGCPSDDRRCLSFIASNMTTLTCRHGLSVASFLDARRRVGG